MPRFGATTASTERAQHPRQRMQAQFRLCTSKAAPNGAFQASYHVSPVLDNYIHAWERAEERNSRGRIHNTWLLPTIPTQNVHATNIIRRVDSVAQILFLGPGLAAGTTREGKSVQLRASLPSRAVVSGINVLVGRAPWSRA